MVIKEGREGGEGVEGRMRVKEDSGRDGAIKNLRREKGLIAFHWLHLHIWLWHECLCMQLRVSEQTLMHKILTLNYRVPTSLPSYKRALAM